MKAKASPPPSEYLVMTKPNAKQTPKAAPRSVGPRRATTRVVTRTVEQDEGDDTQENLDEGEDEYVDPTEEVLESVFAEARGHSGVEIRVYKLDPENRSGARAYAMSISLEDAESGRLLDTLQRKWKGGEFELMARADGRIVKRAVINVLPPPEDERPNPIQAREEIAGIVKASMEPMLQVIAELRNRPQFNFNDVLTKGAMLLPLLGQVRTALGLNSAPPAAASDPLALLTQMKQMKDTMDAMGLSDREPDGMDRMLTLFNSFKPMLEKAMLAQPRTAPRAAPAGPVHAPATAGAAMPIPTVPGAPAAAPAIPDTLQIYIPLLVQAARTGEIVESVGERILSALPDSAVDTLGDALDDGSLVSALLQRREFAGLDSWLNALAQYLLSALSSEEPDTEGDVDVSGGNAGDATGATDDDS